MSYGNVLLKLFAPRGSVEPGKPIPESQKLLTGKFADGGFELLNGPNVGRINQPGFQGKRRSRNPPQICAQTDAWPIFEFLPRRFSLR